MATIRYSPPEGSSFEVPKTVKVEPPKRVKTIFIVDDSSDEEEVKEKEVLEMKPTSSGDSDDDGSIPLSNSQDQIQGIPFLRLDGSTPVSERQSLINKFNNGSIPVFLLSTKAGGLGINLTKADTVIMHDLDFNPENDRQAEDRAHRIGQTRDVTVKKLVCESTVDQAIYTMGERKKKLSEALLANKKKGGSTSRAKAGAEDDDPNTIGNILQGAILDRKKKFT